MDPDCRISVLNCFVLEVGSDHEKVDVCIETVSPEDGDSNVIGDGGRVSSMIAAVTAVALFPELSDAL